MKNNERKNIKEVVNRSKKEPFAEIISAPQIDLLKPLVRANLKKGGADRFAEILTIKK